MKCLSCHLRKKKYRWPASPYFWARFYLLPLPPAPATPKRPVQGEHIRCYLFIVVVVIIIIIIIIIIAECGPQLVQGKPWPLSSGQHTRIGERALRTPGPQPQTRDVKEISVIRQLQLDGSSCLDPSSEEQWRKNCIIIVIDTCQGLSAEVAQRPFTVTSPLSPRPGLLDSFLGDPGP